MNCTEDIPMNPKILDPCSGSRMMWFDQQNPHALFGDIRSETHRLKDRKYQRSLEIHPYVRMDFRNLPFADGQFKLVAFDPPHLVHAGAKSWLALKYGKLGQTWQEDLRQGFAECFRVLQADGVLVFKWNECQIRAEQVLELTPYKPLFGHTTGKRGKTLWFTFMK